jgi:hypothetical protein
MADLIDALEHALAPWLPDGAGANPGSDDVYVPRNSQQPLSAPERERLRAFAVAKLGARRGTLASAEPGGRNSEAFALAAGVGRFVHHGIIAEDEVREAILAACSENGLLKEDGKPAIVATIRSGLHKARNDPLPLLKDDVAEPPLRGSAGRLAVHEAEDLLAQPSTRARWLVDGWMPADDVSLLGADGGTGKTTLALQLGHALQIGWSHWLGLPIVAGPALYFSAEESVVELHRRLGEIADRVAGPASAPHRFGLISYADKDAVLARFDRDGTIRPTPLFAELGQLVRERAARLLVLDAAADVFGGNENDRGQVRSFVRLLRGLALDCNCAVLLLAHPSVDGMKSGRGYSGSTHWNNAVRSRMYFTAAATPEGGESETDLRTLTLEKSNRSRKGQKIWLRWADGAFAVQSAKSGSDVMAVAHAKRVFMDLLAKFTASGRRVGPNPGPNYAPAQFAKEDDANGLGKEILGKAMSSLFDEGRLRADEQGPSSRRYRYLVAEHLQ